MSGTAPIAGRPVALWPKQPAQVKSAVQSTQGISFAALACSRAILRGISRSRRSASENSSSSPPRIMRPSGVVRMYRYGSAASQISDRPGQMASGCGRVASAQVEMMECPRGRSAGDTS